MTAGTLAGERSVREWKRQIAERLRERGMLSDVPSSDPPDGSPLAMGVPGFQLHPCHGVTLDGAGLRTVSRRLSDVLCDTAVRTHVHRAGWLGGYAAGHAYDPVLYRAVRDVFPPRPKAGDDSYWYADLVVYEAGTLPTGEPFRSVGHWNGGRQVEVFQPLLGTIRMIVAGHRDGGRYLVQGTYGPGELCLAPPGAWHLTYVAEGPSVVLNVYAERHTPDRQVRSANAAKYRGGPPVPVTWRAGALRCPPDWSPSADGEPVAGLTARFPTGWLADWFLFSPAPAMRAVEELLWSSWLTSR